MEIIVPEGLNPGVYANGLGIWHTQHDFTLDWVVNLPAQPGEDEMGNRIVRNQLQVVARIKIPASIVFNVLQALNQQLNLYEQQFGPLSPSDPGPMPPPPGPEEGTQ